MSETHCNSILSLSQIKHDFFRRYSSLGRRFYLKLAQDSDNPFLEKLFSIIQGESFARMAGADLGALDPVLATLQFQARQTTYRAYFPQAETYIIARIDNGAPIGQMIIDWTGEEAVQGIDLAVLPQERRGAPGLLGLRAWLMVVDELERPARLNVMPGNPAQQLYRRMGFIPVAPDQVPIPMIRPAVIRRPAQA